MHRAIIGLATASALLGVTTAIHPVNASSFTDLSEIPTQAAMASPSANEVSNEANTSSQEMLVASNAIAQPVGFSGDGNIEANQHATLSDKLIWVGAVLFMGTLILPHDSRAASIRIRTSRD